MALNGDIMQCRVGWQVERADHNKMPTPMLVRLGILLIVRDSGLPDIHALLLRLASRLIPVRALALGAMLREPCLTGWPLMTAPQAGVEMDRERLHSPALRLASTVSTCR